MSYTSGFEPCELHELIPDENVVSNVVSKVIDSSPGPDGVPHSAYRAHANITVALLLAFIACLFTSDFELLPTLLVSYMGFLPPKRFTLSKSGIKIYEAPHVRPLSLSNSFVKLLAVCLKVTLCKIVDSRIHFTQKCISGRSLLDNVILLDACMHKCAMLSLPFAAAFFWDFSSAFPSLARSQLPLAGSASSRDSVSLHHCAPKVVPTQSPLY